MPNFLVNTHAQSSGEHEVHETSCSYLPHPSNRLQLGVFATCKGAVAEAKKKFTNVDGCYHCCRPCHTR